MLQDKLDFLGRLRIFEGLNPDELNALAAICDVNSFKEGSIIAYQRDVADQFYIVQSGRLESFEVDKDGVIIDSQRYMPGDYFREFWLFAPSVHYSTIRAATDGIVYTIREDEFLVFLESHPNAVLDLSENAWEELDHSRAAAVNRQEYRKIALSPGELVEFESRRTGLLLAFLLAPPLAATILLPTTIFLIGWFLLGVGLHWLLLTIAFISGLIPAIWAMLRYLDWANDFLLITNRHLIHSEFDLSTFAGQMLKIPLDQVQSVGIQKNSWVENMVGVGIVRVTTSAHSSGLIFDKVQNPQLIASTLNTIRQREAQMRKGRTRSAVRSSMEDYFNVPKPYETIEASSGGGGRDARIRKDRAGRLVRSGDRVEIGNTITYGRHWVVLFQHTWWVGLMMICALVGGGAFWFSLAIWYIWIVVFLVLLVASFLFYYYYLDWSNDLFQVSNGMVVDIDRKPFRTDEDLKTTDLLNIQNVQVRRPNIWASLFGYGDVIIDTAGASAEIVFEDVANPGRVQADIFERREQKVRDIERSKDASRYKDMLLMLDEYHQLLEQEQIPRRTPPLDATAEEGEQE